MNRDGPVAGGCAHTHSLTHSLSLIRTHTDTLTLPPPLTHSLPLSERIHVEVTAAWLSAIPGSVAKETCSRRWRCGWGRCRRVEKVCCVVREDEEEIGVTERLETFTHTLTDKQGRQTRNHVVTRAGSPRLCVHAHQSLAGCPIFTPRPAPSPLSSFPPFVRGNFTFKYAISITPKPRDPPPNNSKHCLKKDASISVLDFVPAFVFSL